MLASPYEFFIVVTRTRDPITWMGATPPFGKVIEGMDVVDDRINQVTCG